VVKRSLGLMIMLCAGALSAHGAAVSCLIVETGLKQEGAVGGASTLLENGLLDALFEGGHIVSSSPTIRLKKMPREDFPLEASKELAEAVEGGMEYFIITWLEYQNNGGRSTLKKASLSLFTTQPCKKIAEQPLRVVQSGSAHEVMGSAQEAARALMARIN